MSKARRLKRFRLLAMASGRKDARSVARALRRHGRMPLDKREGQA